MGRDAKKAMLISLLISGELKNTHTQKNTRYMKHKKPGKHFYTKIVQDTMYMGTWIHTPCIITIFFRCQPSKWRDISRDLVIFFLIMSLTVIYFLNLKVITVTADSQVTTGAKMSEGTVYSTTTNHRQMNYVLTYLPTFLPIYLPMLKWMFMIPAFTNFYYAVFPTKCARSCYL